jgi:YspA, cpYpsA-related SLOG family
MKVIIAGTRTFQNKNMLDVSLDYLYGDQYSRDKRNNTHITEVVCGLAKGADLLGKEWALEHDIPVREFAALWDIHGKGAGPMRNWDMAYYADEAVVFWDGKSKGSLHMIRAMISLNKPVWVRGYGR